MNHPASEVWSRWSNPSRRRRIAALIIGSAIALIWTVGAAAPASAVFPSLSLTEVEEGGIQIVDRNGELLYEFAGPTGGFRVPVPLARISPNLIKGTIATEDADFYDNPGISFRGLARATFENLAFWETGGLLRGSGGSSVTQQVVKNLHAFGDAPQRNPVTKIREVAVALTLARRYSKDEILSWYLNSVFYGSAAYGAEAASQRYFGKPASDLSLAEAAFLVGIPNAPSIYDVDEDLDAVRFRQRDVLDLIVRHRDISAEEADLAYDEELQFRSADFQIQAPHFVMYVRELLPALLGEAAMHEGLRVVTTLDLGLQRTAERTLEQHLTSIQPAVGRPDGALVAIDPGSGEILAMVGGRWFFADPVAGQVNNATALNQPGSAMKPITYLAAFQKGWAPATIIEDRPIQSSTGTRPYTLQNFDGRYAGQVTAREALGSSLNVPAVHALEFAGLENVHKLAGRMGLTTLQDARSYGPAFTLGGADVTLLDLTYVFSVLAGGGEQHGTPSHTGASAGQRPLDPTAVLRVGGARGEKLWEYQPRVERIAPAAYTYLTTNILSDNAARLRTFGANNPLVLPGRPAAAKTGLTDDPRDAWTFGYTPQLVAGVWVGNKNNAPMPGASSSLVASPIWHQFMVDALQNEPAVAFDRPEDVQLRPVCHATGLPPDRGCAQEVTDVFVTGQGFLPPQLAQTVTSPNTRDSPPKGKPQPKGKERG